MTSSKIERDELGASFSRYERAPEKFLIGAESEKFGVDQQTGQPLGYGGEFSVCEVLGYLRDNHHWSEITETEGGPVIGLTRQGASITLEPSAQLELSGEALPSLHAIKAESDAHLAELRPISEKMGIAWLTTGFHPLASLNELPWVPKLRYPIMRKYLPAQGIGGLDMMQRTATVQGNFDWKNERDALRKLVVCLKLSPLMHAWFANSPFSEKKRSTDLSVRGTVWRNMDRSRSGLIPSIWAKKNASYQDYAEWALSAGMFLIKREGKILQNTGQTFTDFMKNGFQGHQATLEDWTLHLSTLFPEVRLKNTLEVRSVDGLPPHLALASLSLWTGILYDERALDEAESLVEELQYERMESERDELVARGLHATVHGRSGFSWAEHLHDVARGGLLRRHVLNEAREGEELYLDAARDLLERRKMPAEDVIDRFEKGQSFVEATRFRF